MGLSENLLDSLAAAPELTTSPGFTTGLATAQAPPGVGAYNLAQAASHAVNKATGAAVATQADQQHPGILGHIGAFFGKVPGVEPAMTALSKPLGAVQHEYRYLRAVTDQHGVLAGALEGLAMAGVGVGATVLTGGNLAAGMLAAEGTGDVLGHVAFHDLWDKTNTSYTDVAGRQVTPGLDLANLVDHVLHGHDYHPNSGVDLPTGLINAVFDLSLDPTLKAGQLAKASKLEGLNVGGKQVVTGRMPQLLPDGARADNVLDIYNGNASVRRAVDVLAQTSHQDILKQFPALRPLAAPLGRASTPGEVLDVLRDAVTAKNYAVFTDGLPHTGVTRLSLAKASAADWVQNIGARPLKDATGKPVLDVTGQPVTGFGVNAEKAKVDPMYRVGQVIHAATSYRPFSIDSAQLDLTNKKFNPDDPFAQDGIYRVLRYSQDKRTADRVLAQFQNASTTAQKIAIVENSFVDVLRAAGVPDTHPLLASVRGELRDYLGNVKNAVYAADDNGHNIMGIHGDGDPKNFGLLINHQGELAYPNFADIRSAVRESQGGLTKAFSKADDWTYSHYTAKWFKQLALMSLGFGVRVSTGELIPASLGLGGKKVLAGALSVAADRLGYSPELPQLVAEHGAEPFAGVAVRHTTSGYGRIVSVNPDTASAEVKMVTGETKDLPLKQLQVFQKEIKDDQLAGDARLLGMQVPDAIERPHIKAAVGKALYGLSRAVGDPLYAQIARMNVMSLGGHYVAPGLIPGSHSPTMQVDKATKWRADMSQLGMQIPDKYQMGDSYRLYSAGDDTHPMHWAYAIDEASNDQGIRLAAQAHLRALAAGKTQAEASVAAKAADKAFLESPAGADWRQSMVHAQDNLPAYVELRDQLRKGLWNGRSAPDASPVFHRDVAQAIANGEGVPIAKLQDIPVDQRPIAVKGRTLTPGPMNAENPAFGFVWKKILDPVINHFSREPLYTAFTTEEYRHFLPWVNAGQMDPYEALSIAQTRAMNRMLPFIHNTMLRSQLSDWFRNAYPFYFAQEQAYKRYGRLVLKDPVAFEKARLGVHAISESGMLQQDGNGFGYVTLPGSNLLTRAVNAIGLVGAMSGMPTSISGNIGSLKTVMPEGQLPSLSPLTAVPVKALSGMLGDHGAFLKSTPGYTSYADSQPMWRQLMPNATIARVVQGIQGDDRDRSFFTAYAYSMQWAQHQADSLRAQAAKVDPRASDLTVDPATLTPKARELLKKADGFMPSQYADPHVKQQALDRIRNAARISFFVKAAIGAVSPLSPVTSVGDVGLRAEVQADISRLGLGAGIQAFMAKHPDASTDTVFLSDSRFTGTSLPASQEAANWLDANHQFVKNNTYAAAYLIPQDPGAFSYKVYNDELAAGLRQRKTPKEMLTALQAAATNQQFFPALENYQSVQAQTSDPTQRSKNSQMWNDYVSTLATANPVWWSDLNDPTKAQTAQYAYQQLHSALASGQAPQSNLTAHAAELDKNYQDYLNMKAAIAAGAQTGMSAGQADASFRNYLKNYEAAFPMTSGLISGIFRRLIGYGA